MLPIRLFVVESLDLAQTLIMKFILILVSIFLPFINHAQETCFSEDLILFNQEVATNFSANYPDCTVILGDVVLQGNVNFLGMEQLVEIQGTIRCGGDGECNGIHDDFLGLENVTSIGGISLEEHVFSFDGLTSLEWVTGSLLLDECTIADFSALANLIEIGVDFRMTETNFASFNGMQNLASVGQDFKVSENALLLTSLYLESLVSVGGSFELSECDVIDGFEGFDGLTSVGGDFIIDDCPLVTSLDGFANIPSIAGVLKIRSNENLVDISGIANFDPASISMVEIMSNPLLSMCAVTSVCGYLLSDGSSLIEMNSEGCTSAEVIIEQCVTSVFSDGNSESTFRLVNTLVASELRMINPLNSTYSVLDGLGRTVLSSSANPLFIGHLSPGLYFVQVDYDGSVHKFVVQD